LTGDLLYVKFIGMTTISISKLKENPSKAIFQALDYPLAIENRNKISAYLIGKELYEKFVSYLENRLDTAVVEKTDFKKGKDFELLAKELGV